MRMARLLLLICLGIVPMTARADMPMAIERAKAGTFDARGEILCAQEVGQALGDCDAAIARADGSVVVVVTFPNGFARTLMFADGAFLRGNPTMSGVGTDTDWRLDGDTYHVRVDDQRFELPQALVFGD